MKRDMSNTITKDSPAFQALKAVLEDWAIEYGICLYPDRLAIDAADYIHDQLLEAGEA